MASASFDCEKSWPTMAVRRALSVDIDGAVPLLRAARRSCRGSRTSIFLLQASFGQLRPSTSAPLQHAIEVA